MVTEIGLLLHCKKLDYEGIFSGLLTVARSTCTKMYVVYEGRNQKEMSRSFIQGPSYAAMISWQLELSAQHNKPKINHRYARTLT